ncbi:hypothetical protein B0H67DRAFT_141912 [Lasiosphaeris hirsuta]|uniref:Uncharacterized protein n=1 Tax=Lasiosphaeris hirsuta TaxID=260670 RepID=A0AA40B1G3_9PEZI|nr:hypothetical protein B0H67DRAFT_141912 [Lasiosphaeris hirsuta]
MTLAALARSPPRVHDRALSLSHWSASLLAVTGEPQSESAEASAPAFAPHRAHQPNMPVHTRTERPEPSCREGEFRLRCAGPHLGDSKEQHVMRRPPPAPSLSSSQTAGGGADSISGAAPSSRSSFCASSSSDSCPPISDELDASLCASVSSLCSSPYSSVLLDLELSSDEMTRSVMYPREPCDPCGPCDCLVIDIDLDWPPQESPPAGSTAPPPAAPNPAFAVDPTAAAWQTGGEDDHGKQPWREFWPPTRGTPFHQRVASLRPDVLSFSFDRHNHLLQHPWQAWKSPQPDAVDPGRDEEEYTLSDTDELPSAHSGSSRRSRCSSSVEHAREELDELVQVDLQLPHVTPREFNYLRPLRRYERERPYRLQLPPGLTPIPNTNVLTKSYHPAVHINDMSGHEDKFKLDVSGFQFFKCPVSVGEWNDQAIMDGYLPALQDWAVRLLGGDSGLVYSYNRPWDPLSPNNPLDPRTLEISDDEDEDECYYSMKRYLAADRRDDHYNAIAKVKADPCGPCRWKTPLFRVHCDASENTHKRRMPMYFPDDFERLMKGRVRLVSVWRTLSTHVQDTPLALCDARTVNREDLVPMDIVYPHFADEVYEVKYNKSHRWFYNKRMKTDDVAIFKLHDTHSKETVCPHTAFVNPEVPENTPPRTSIEVKMMIFGGDLADDRDAH